MYQKHRLSAKSSDSIATERHNIVKYAFIILMLVCLTGQAMPAFAADDLHILTSDKIMPPAVVDKFEREYGIRLRIEHFDSQEALTAYLSGRPKYDLALLRSHYVEGLRDKQLLAPLNHKILSNFGNLAREAMMDPNDPGCLYSLPYLVGNLGILYRTGFLAGNPSSWGFIFTDNAGAMPFALTDQYRDALGTALLSLGYSYNSTSASEIEEAAEKIRELTQRPAFISFTSPDLMLRYLREKVIYIALTTNNLAAMAMSMDPSLSYVTPENQGIVWAYTFVISSSSQRLVSAHRWLNFTLRPDIAAEIAAWNMATSPNQAALALLPPEIRSNPVLYPPETIWHNAAAPRNVGDVEKLYVDFWSRLK